MKFHVFPSTDNGCATPERALLIFAGWSMDEKPFATLHRAGYQVIVVWDYRETGFPPLLAEQLATYREIVVIGWSFGVPAASRFLSGHPDLPVTARIAVNGTMHPVDDLRGIPEAIFQGTLDGLNEKTLSKFHLRMCGSGDAYRKFALNLPDRAIDELREELEAVRAAGDAAVTVWDRAIVSTNDRIIPPENQLRAWQSGEAFDTISLPGAHLPDFQAIADGFITEKGLVAEKFGRAEETYDENAVVQHEIAAKLCDMAGDCDREKALRIIEIGCGTGMTTRLLAEKFPQATIEAWDLHIASTFPPQELAARIGTRECDAETEIRRIPEGSVDMIFSASTVQWFNSLPEFLRRVSRVLRPGGRALISTFGPDTMREIRSQLPQPNRYHDRESLLRMMPDGLQLKTIGEERRCMTFSSPLEALRHVKLTGVNALGHDHSGARTREVIRNYPLRPDGSATLTYHPIYISLQKP